MKRILAILLTLLSFLLSCKRETKNIEASNNQKLQFIMEELHENISRERALDPERIQAHYHILSKLTRVSLKMRNIDNLTSKEYNNLTNSYLEHIEEVYQIVTEEYSYKEKIKNALSELNFEHNKQEIPATYFYTSILASLDIQNELNLAAVYVDTIKLYKKEVFVSNQKQYQLLPIVESKTTYSGFVFNSDTFYRPPDSMLIPSTLISDSLTLKYSILTKGGALLRSEIKIK